MNAKRKENHTKEINENKEWIGKKIKKEKEKGKDEFRSSEYMTVLLLEITKSYTLLIDRNTNEKCSKDVISPLEGGNLGRPKKKKQ